MLEAEAKKVVEGNHGEHKWFDRHLNSRRKRFERVRAKHSVVPLV